MGRTGTVNRWINVSSVSHGGDRRDRRFDGVGDSFSTPNCGTRDRRMGLFLSDLANRGRGGYQQNTGRVLEQTPSTGQRVVS